jgi:hypothetical protein
LLVCQGVRTVFSPSGVLWVFGSVSQRPLGSRGDVDFVISVRLGDGNASLLPGVLGIALVLCRGDDVLVAVAERVACQEGLVDVAAAGALLAFEGFPLVHLVVLLLSGGAGLLQSHFAVGSGDALQAAV